MPRCRTAELPGAQLFRTGIWTLAIIAVFFARCRTAMADESLTFNRDIRPILSEYCGKCHGPDANARKAGLRLDIRDGAIMSAESGSAAITPHDPEASELLSRVSADDDSLRMPPAETGRRLSPAQIGILRRWIAEGAAYQRHWAFEPPSKPAVPVIDGAEHPIDAFVLLELRKHNLSFSPEAPRETLLRRVNLDLTGLPPELEDLDRLGENYEQAVDRLLASPHFGEHAAVAWLDAARYADTNGYFSDKPRQMWLWRDWVIRAFNSNMPFDQFTIEQLAGDLLPQPTLQQRIATGFNRNHVANNETGIIDEEFRVAYVVDRVDTTLTTWMGLTAGCAQCHDHKYDPLTQRDFYQLFAFFNNVPETGLIVTDNPPPLITVTTPEQDRQLAALAASRAEAETAFKPLKAQVEAEIKSWEPQALNVLPRPPQNALVHEAFDGDLSSATRPVGTSIAFLPGVRGMAAKFDATQHATQNADIFDADSAWSIGFWILPEGSLSCPLSKIEAEGDRRGWEIIVQKGRIAVNLVDQWGISAIEAMTVSPFASGQWHHVVVCYDGTRRARGLRILIDGARAEVNIQRDSLHGSLTNRQSLKIGRRDSGLGYYGLIDELRILQESLSDGDVADWFRAEQIRGILEKPAASRGSRDLDTLLDDYIAHDCEPAIQSARQHVRTCSEAETRFRSAIPTTLVMEELPEPRQAHILTRGQYDQPGEAVAPGIPAAFSGWPDDAPRNRLSFAHWLVSDSNPLTARVAVNRLWFQCFGEGLVRTMNDFGTQGEAPTHPELLDWLAVTFRESGWDTKALLRLIVTSKTYRQASGLHHTGALDPQNHLLSRGPRFRMSAEMIRDQMLAVSGLLREQIGGPAVKPWQPPGLWEEVSYNGEDTYVPDDGDSLWRRSIYTFLKRQAPPPSFLAFDGTTREKCAVQRDRTNTPMQSLILLNDPSGLHAARRLAVLSLRAAAEDRDAVHVLFRRILSRFPHDDETDMLLGLLQRQQRHFTEKPAEARTLLTAAKRSSDIEFSDAVLAAWTVVAHTILNLDEAITRQ